MTDSPVLSALRASPALVVPPGSHVMAHVERLQDEDLTALGVPGPPSVSTTYTTPWGPRELFRWYHSRLDGTWDTTDLHPRRFGFLGINGLGLDDPGMMVHLEMQPSAIGTRVWVWVRVVSIEPAHNPAPLVSAPARP